MTSAVRADNLRTLLSVRDADDTPRLARLRERAARIVRNADLIQIGQILEQLHIEDATPVLQLVDQGTIYADLEQSLLSVPANVWVANDPNLPPVVSATGFRFKNAILVDEAISTDQVPDPRHVAEVAARFAACGLIEPMQGQPERSARTKRRYMKLLREHKDAPQVLFPRWSRCGNRKPRVCPEHLDLLCQVIKKIKGDPNLPTASNGYLEYLSRWQSLSLKDI